MTTAYGICLLISVAVFIYMAQKNYNNMDAYYWTFVVLAPVTIMGYWLKTTVQTPEAVAYLFCFIYLDSTFLVVTILFSMLHSLGVPVRPWMKIVAYSLSAAHMAMVTLNVHTNLYYQSIEIIDTGIGHATKMVSGPLKIFHFVYLIVMAVWLIVMVIPGIRRKGTYSRRTLLIYGAVLGVGFGVHLAEALLDVDFTVLPFLYVIGELMVAVDYDYAHAHDVACVLLDRQKIHETHGYVTIGMSRHFLGCNEKAFDYLPFLKKQRVDDRIDEDEDQKRMILGLITDYEQKKTTSVKYTIGEMTCVCELAPFSMRDGGRTIGYLLDIRDATEEQRNYDIITSYNETLNAEVVEKTNSIRDIQRKIVLGMANMIENRDNNTGGHVRRTSDIIHIIVDEIRRQGKIPLTEEFANDIVRAAPTHDLGKISIDLKILNKPGRLTAEEFEIMKTHSTKSGEMVLILLEGVEEERFVKVAFNVARFHHERWDGRGYPEGLVGSMIPLEARIMAVADVYDALVSKRCYKEAMSFEQAEKIMVENMGTQFDPNMEGVFLGCREKLEEYYRQNPA